MNECQGHKTSTSCLTRDSPSPQSGGVRWRKSEGGGRKIESKFSCPLAKGTVRNRVHIDLLTVQAEMVMKREPLLCLRGQCDTAHLSTEKDIGNESVSQLCDQMTGLCEHNTTRPSAVPDSRSHTWEIPIRV